jgi:hypothetical protein
MCVFGNAQAYDTDDSNIDQELPDGVGGVVDGSGSGPRKQAAEPASAAKPGKRKMVGRGTRAVCTLHIACWYLMAAGGWGALVAAEWASMELRRGTWSSASSFAARSARVVVHRRADTRVRVMSPHTHAQDAEPEYDEGNLGDAPAGKRAKPEGGAAQVGRRMNSL